MKIEAVTVCVDYADFLAWFLLWNKRHFDHLVVVTSSADKATQNLCACHHVQCVVTDAFFDGGQAFNKGAGINAGLKALAKTDWICHIDADIILPPRAREMIEARANVDRSAIYGIDRIMCRSFTDWLDFVADPELQHADEVYVNASAFTFGSRVAKTNADGYLPIGFFQLWNAATSEVTTYPEGHGTAARGDMIFARQWQRQQRVLIPEIVAIHLESETGANGANWRGRRTQPFRAGAAA
jgi:hypothetical protein